VSRTTTMVLPEEVTELPAPATTEPILLPVVTPLRAALGLDELGTPGNMLQARALADRHPESPVALVRMAQAALANGATDLAVDYATRCVAVPKSTSRLSSRDHARHAALLVLLSVQGGSDVDLDGLLEADPIPGSRALLAGRYIARGDAEGALKVLSFSDDPLGSAMRGWLLIELQPTAAIAAFREALKAGLRSVDVLANLGYAMNSVGSVRGAIRFTTEATLLAPSDTIPAYNLSYYLNRAGEPSKAVAVLDNLAERRPDDVDVALRRAWAYVHLNDDWRVAAQLLKKDRDRLWWSASPEKRNELDASVAYADYRLGKRTAAAVEKLLWSKVGNTTSAEPVRMLASLLVDSGNTSGLKRLLGVAEARLSTSGQHVLRAKLAVLESRLLDGLTHALLAMEAAPDDAEAAGLAAYIASESGGDPDHAIVLARQALNLDASSKLLANNLAVVLAMSGRVPDAERAIRDAGGADNLPFHGATAGLVLLSKGLVQEGLETYARAIDGIRREGDVEFADLVEWRKNIALVQLGLVPVEVADLAEPKGKSHSVPRAALRHVVAQLLTA